MQAWQATVQDEAGNIVVNPAVSVYLLNGTTLAAIYNEDGTVKANPFMGNLEGFVQFWVPAGHYKIVGTLGTDRTEVWDFVATAKPYANYTEVNAAVATLPSDSPAVSAVVEGRLQEWIRSPGGTAFGGGWRPADGTTARAFGGNLTAAHATGTAVDYGDRLWPGDSTVGYLNTFGFSKYRTALESRLQLGTAAVPDPRPEPVTATVKFTSADRTADPGAWTQGGYYGLIKRSGTAYGSALTGVARSDGGLGDMIGVHGRAQSSTSGVGQLFGMWAYASYDAPSGLPPHLTGIEVNVVNRSGDSNFPMPIVGGNAESRGVCAVTADGGRWSQNGFSVERMGGTGGWLLGYRVRADAIVPSLTPGVGRTCAFRIEGGLSEATSYGGISFEGRFFDYGLDFSQITEPFLNNAAIRLRPNDRIYFGSDAAGRFMSRPNGVNAINFNNLAIQINEQQVLTTRQPAISNATSGAYVGTINSILDAMRAHGLINP